MNSFWKSWHTKFSKQEVSAVTAGVCVCVSEPAAIAEKFAEMFMSVCVPTDAERHKALTKNDFSIILEL